MQKVTRDIWTVSRFEALRAIGSVRGIMVLALYLVSSAVSGVIYVKLSGLAETQLGNVIKQQQGTDAEDPEQLDVQKLPVWQSFGKWVAGEDEATATMLGNTPPIVIVAFFLAIFFLPLILLLTAHDVIARDNEIRSLRYVRPRTSTTAWVVGKFVAHAGLIITATIASGFVVYAVAVSMVESFDPIAGGLAFAQFWWRLFFYELGFLGVLFALSAVMHSAFTALLSCSFAIFVLWIVQWIPHVRYVSPFTYNSTLLVAPSLGLLQTIGVYLLFALAGIALSILSLEKRDI